jgi:hypothetical protein
VPEQLTRNDDNRRPSGLSRTTNSRDENTDGSHFSFTSRTSESFTTRKEQRVAGWPCADDASDTKMRFPTLYKDEIEEDYYGEAYEWRTRRTTSETRIFRNGTRQRSSLDGENTTRKKTGRKDSATSKRASKREGSSAAADPGRRSSGVWEPLVSSSSKYGDVPLAGPSRWRVSSEPSARECSVESRFPWRPQTALSSSSSVSTSQPDQGRWMLSSNGFGALSPPPLLSSPPPLASAFAPLVRLGVVASVCITAFFALASIVASSYGLTVWDDFQNRMIRVGDAAGQARKRIEHGVQWGREAAGTIAAGARGAMGAVVAAGALVRRKSNSLKQGGGGVKGKGGSSRGGGHYQNVRRSGGKRAEEQQESEWRTAFFNGFFVGPGIRSATSWLAARDSEDYAADTDSVNSTTAPRVDTGSETEPDGDSSSALPPRPNPLDHPPPHNASAASWGSSAGRNKLPPHPPLKFLLPSIVLTFVFFFIYVVRFFWRSATEGRGVRLSGKERA